MSCIHKKCLVAHVAHIHVHDEHCASCGMQLCCGKLQNLQMCWVRVAAQNMPVIAVVHLRLCLTHSTPYVSVMQSLASHRPALHATQRTSVLQYCKCTLCVSCACQHDIMHQLHSECNRHNIVREWGKMLETLTITNEGFALTDLVGATNSFTMLPCATATTIVTSHRCIAHLRANNLNDRHWAPMLAC